MSNIVDSTTNDVVASSSAPTDQQQQEPSTSTAVLPVHRKRGRMRAHSNPLSFNNFPIPHHPYQYDWAPQYPAYLTPKVDSNVIVPPTKHVTIADIGSGFGGLLMSLSSHFPDDLIAGLEIRMGAVEVTQSDIDIYRAAQKTTLPNGIQVDWDSRNIAVLNTNIMKYAPHHFVKGQLNKMFILFADPHFKQIKHRLRVINQTYLDIYAHLIAVGGILYTITDVEDLYLWQKKHLDAHPLFERIPNEDLDGIDICYELIHNGTQEGVKVTANGGNKYPACYRRVEFNPNKIDPMADKERIELLLE